MTNIHPLGTITQRPLTNIHPATDNPRIINQAAIDVVAKSITRFGWQQPIVVDGQGTILAGHTRHLAAKSLGLSAVPVVVSDHLTDEEAKAYRIADNRTGDFSTWDYPELVTQLEELSSDFGEELALADWQSIVGEFESTYGEGALESLQEAPQDPPPPPVDARGDVEYPEPDNSVHTPPRTVPVEDPMESLTVEDGVAGQLHQSFEITVVCASECAAGEVQAALLGMDGVVDVRYKR